MKHIALFACFVLVASACAADPDTTATAPVPGSTVAHGRPPDLVVAAGDTELTLGAYSYCWSSESGEERQVVCADGVPPDPLPSITLAEDADLAVAFPLPWSLDAWLSPNGEICDGGFMIDVDHDGQAIGSLGPEGTYRVELFGRGEEGDAAWAFEMTTTRDTQWPDPYGQVLWYPSGRDLEAGSPFGAIMGNLVAPPSDVGATVSVTAGNGAQQRYPLSQVEMGRCWQGTIAFDAAADFTASVLELGPEPYEVSVTAVIDGSIVISDPLRWPDDFPANSNESPRLAVTGTLGPLLPDGFELPGGNKAIARFPFKDGAVVVIEDDQPDVTSFWTVELFTGGGDGFVGGGPGETWQECYRVDYSDAGYAIVTVEDPDWIVRVGMATIDVVPVGDVAMALVEGSFDRPPTVSVTNGGGIAC